MNKVLLLGADGLLGSCLENALLNVSDLELVTTARNGSADRYFSYSPRALRGLMREVRPDIVVNCIAATSVKSSFLTMLRVNSFLPIRLAIIGITQKFEVIHFSTNVVFSGMRSENFETTLPFPRSKYGFTKLVGDLSFFKNLVIRSSFVGSSPKSTVHTGLVMKLRNLEKNSTYEIADNHIWNGVTTDAICELIAGVVKQKTYAHGLIHLGSKDTTTRQELVQCLLKMLQREDITLIVRPGRKLKNLVLQTRRVRLVSKLWSNTSYQAVPEIGQLLPKMKI